LIDVAFITLRVLLCFIKPILGNHYVRYWGFIVSDHREKNSLVALLEALRARIIKATSFIHAFKKLRMAPHKNDRALRAFIN